MKKLLTLTLAVLLAFSLIACKKAPIVVKDGDNTVVVTATSANSGATLVEYMNEIKTVSFVVENKMVTSIDGISNTSTSFWMLYTDDADNSDTSYSIEYKEKTYGTSLYGIETLVVKNGCTYIWVYQTF